MDALDGRGRYPDVEAVGTHGRLHGQPQTETAGENLLHLLFRGLLRHVEDSVDAAHGEDAGDLATLSEKPLSTRCGASRDVF
jgi:hypothetical protein